MHCLPRSFLKLAAALALAGAVSACSNPFAPYRMEIQQGNYVTQEMASQLKVGMTKEQVRFALGTPLINDSFHQNRWDYVFTRQRNRSSPLEERRMTVFFDQSGRLERVDGDIIPALDSPAASSGVSAAPPNKP
jgi:outer membrane protein assembly factor BamE